MMTAAIATAGIPTVAFDVNLGAVPAICFAVGMGIVAIGALLDLRDRRRPRPHVALAARTPVTQSLRLAA